MSSQESLLSYFREEINPSFEKNLRKAIDLHVEKEKFSQNDEAQKIKRKQELFKLFNLEGRQKEFLDGLYLVERFYPFVLSIDEQKRFLFEMHLGKKKAINSIREVPGSGKTAADLCGISPYVLACMWRIANVTFQKHNLSDALTLYHAVLCLNETIEGVWNSYGQCLKASNQFEDALLAFKNAHTLNPNNPLPLIGLIQCAKSQKDTEMAASTLKTLEELLQKTERTAEFQDVVSQLREGVA